MAKKAPKIAAPVAPEVPVEVNPVKKPCALEARVSELEADLLRLAKLCGQVWGEPLASAALEIVTKRGA
jgi:hypothetical protein